ncbi:MAG TPA: hypothetical protein VF666_12950 [Pyrinomonadaceae bacterium]|jgi:tetratricopeptide (TPR) repeat protein
MTEPRTTNETENATTVASVTTATANVAATQAPRTRRRMRELLLVLLILSGLSSAAALTRWHEARRPVQQNILNNDELYVSPQTARRMSLGFNGLIADWYWMRALQYVGRKAIAHGSALQLDDLSPLALSQLAPLLDHTTTLDPHFMAAYEYGAVVLPSVDIDAAISLINKGIRENPRAWRLRHHLGYIYWQRGRFREAATAYEEGARVEGAPAWMRVMSAQMEVNGGSREMARNIYRRMYSEADDEQVKRLALKRLLQVDSLDERDLIRSVLEVQRAKVGRCPRQWREASALLRDATLPNGVRLKLDANSAPLDPTGVAYVLSPDGCDVQLHGRSEIPQK